MRYVMIIRYKRYDNRASYKSIWAANLIARRAIASDINILSIDIIDKETGEVETVER